MPKLLTKKNFQIIHRLHSSAIYALFRPYHTSRSLHRGDHSIHRSSPLIHFISAELSYAPQQQQAALSQVINDADTYSELGLEKDTIISQSNKDLLLETENALQSKDHEQLHRLQRYWNQFTTHANQSTALHIENLEVFPNDELKSLGGGHILLGKNGSGKSLILKSMIQSLQSVNCPTDACEQNSNPYLQSGRMHINENPNISQTSSPSMYNQLFSHVSFETHSQILTNPTSVHRALIPGGGNRLSPTAQFLIVRLGMYPLLQRKVDTLSTGEIRRVLLVRSLVTKPSLLLLDNVMDGLDATGRDGVQNILERILSGFRMDILVQGVNARDAARTQILLSTLRSEEISEGFGMVTFVNGKQTRTELRNRRSGDSLIRCLGHWSKDDTSYHDFVWSLDGQRKEACYEEAGVDVPAMFSRQDLPTATDINNFWEFEKPKSENVNPLIQANELKVVRDETTLLLNLTWTVERGQRWHLAGTNGAGKSTLGRLLLRKSIQNHLPESDDATIIDGSVTVTNQTRHGHSTRGGVTWVSTELHLHASKNWKDHSVIEIMSLGACNLFFVDKHKHYSLNEDIEYSAINLEACITALQWIGLFDDSSGDKHLILSRKFSTLSQGQQKLLLLASSIAQRPSLLILDEPCQGLDAWNRAHVLGLVDAICKSTDMALVYITHHEEELIDSISKVLRLADGKVAFCGDKHH